jgi:hypothetical protein
MDNADCSSPPRGLMKSLPMALPNKRRKLMRSLADRHSLRRAPRQALPATVFGRGAQATSRLSVEWQLDLATVFLQLGTCTIDRLRCSFP